MTNLSLCYDIFPEESRPFTCSICVLKLVAHCQNHYPQGIQQRGRRERRPVFPEPNKAEIRKHDETEPEDKEMLAEI